MTVPRWRIPIVLIVLVLAVAASACSSAPAATGQAAASAGAQAGASNLFLMADMVQGSKNIPKEQSALRSCVLNSRFPRNGEMVWRVRVFDPKTGDLMDANALSQVEVQLANGKTVDLDYSAHPKDPPGESYWAASWVVPKDAPTGSLKYKIVATAADGRTGTFEPFSVASALPTITDEVLADAPSK